jgi:hypothetical protein
MLNGLAIGGYAECMNLCSRYFLIIMLFVRLQRPLTRERAVKQLMRVMNERKSDQCVFQCSRICQSLCQSRSNKRILIEAKLVIIIQE